jgi:hypothetical protein
VKKMLNWVVRTFFLFSESVFEGNQITREISRLTRLSDNELRRMGLSRNEITHYVVRSRAYI